LIIDDNLSWKQHCEYIINKLASTCFAVRNIRSLVTLDTLRAIYFSHVHSIMSYGIMFWGGFTNVQKVFLMLKRIIRVMMNRRPRDSCRKIFKTMEIMTFYSQYIYALLLFMINNKNVFMTNNELHEYKTRIYNNLHLPVFNLVKFDKGAYITSIKVFNHLPLSVKILVNNEKSFKTTLKGFLYHHSFYAMKEYYQHTGD
jgi:hypothetical protein